MTKQLESTLGLRSIEEALAELSEKKDEAEKANKQVDDIANALERIVPSNLATRDEEGIIDHEDEMNEIYQEALKSHRQMVNLGFNVDAHTAGKIFEPAARLLEIAMNASRTKSEQKLRTLEVRMKREKLDSDLKKNMEEGTIESEDVSGFVADRNELIADLLGKLKHSKSK